VAAFIDCRASARDKRRRDSTAPLQIASIRSGTSSLQATITQRRRNTSNDVVKRYRRRCAISLTNGVPDAFGFRRGFNVRSAYRITVPRASYGKDRPPDCCWRCAGTALFSCLPSNRDQMHTRHNRGYFPHTGVAVTLIGARDRRRS